MTTMRDVVWYWHHQPHLDVAEPDRVPNDRRVGDVARLRVWRVVVGRRRRRGDGGADSERAS
jgi:hypothetical protein